MSAKTTTRTISALVSRRRPAKRIITVEVVRATRSGRTIEVMLKRVARKSRLTVARVPLDSHR